MIGFKVIDTKFGNVLDNPGSQYPLLVIDNYEKVKIFDSEGNALVPEKSLDGPYWVDVSDALPKESKKEPIADILVQKHRNQIKAAKFINGRFITCLGDNTWVDDVTPYVKRWMYIPEV